MNGDVPDGALKAGYMGKKSTKEPLYVALGLYKDRKLVGSLNPKKGSCSVALNGSVGKLTAYEVLCNVEVHWVKDNGEEFKQGRGGNEQLDNTYYWRPDEKGKEPPITVARAKFKDCLVIGYYSEADQKMHAAVHGKEKTFDRKEFEWLVFKSPVVASASSPPTKKGSSSSSSSASSPSSASSTPASKTSSASS